MNRDSPGPFTSLFIHCCTPNTPNTAYQASEWMNKYLLGTSDAPGTVLPSGMEQCDSACRETAVQERH